MKLGSIFTGCATVLALTCSLPAVADSGLSCYGAQDEQPQDRAQLAEITVKSAFYDYRYPSDWNDNPNLENGHFQQGRNYLVPGDRLVVGPEQRGYRCGYYISAKGRQTANWIKADSVRVLDNVAPTGWQGYWVSNDSRRQLIVTKKRAEYQFVGGGQDPSRISFTFPFTEPAINQDALLVAQQPTDTPCELKLHRLGEYLIITNGESCAMTNANPDGVLRKR